jgi:hypothetical protein
MLTGSGFVALAIMVLRLAFYAMRASEDGRQAPQHGTWNKRPDPKRRKRRHGVMVDVALDRPSPGRPAIGASVSARWAFGEGPPFVLARAHNGAVVRGEARVSRLVGAALRYTLSSDGDDAVGLVISPAILRGLDDLPDTTVLRATKERVELVMYDGQIEESVIPHASKLVGSIAGFGVDLLRERLAPIDGAKILEADEATPTHAHIPTRAGDANLDFDLGPDGLTATLVVETAAVGDHITDLDAEGALGGDDCAWADRVAVHARRGIGPAKLSLEDGWVELVWNELPTSDQLSRGAELLATLAMGAGPAYR